MAFLESKALSAGELIGAAFEEMARVRREVLVYLGVFLLADITGSLASTAVPGIDGIASLVLFGGYFVAQYLLYRIMLRRAGHVVDGRFRIFRFVGMAIVIAFGLLFSIYMFVIPAIILGARWIAAPCYLVATDRGVFASIGESWSVTSGSTLPLSLAFTAMVIAFGVVAGVLGGVGAALEGLLGTELSFGFSSHVLPLLLMGLSVAAFRRLNDEGVELAAVFA